MKIQEIELTKLKAYEKNPRRNDEAVPLVANSIKEFGFKVPVVVDKDYTVVAGHTRIRAAELLGMKSVPCVVADDLTPTQIKAFRLADNKTAEFSTWDFAGLAGELEDLTDIDMVDFGFETFDFTDADFTAPERPKEEHESNQTHEVTALCKNEEEADAVRGFLRNANIEYRSRDG